MAAILTPEQNERVREAARELVRQNKGNASATARQIGVSQSFFQRFMDEKSGASVQTAAAIALHVGVSAEALLRESDDDGMWRAQVSTVSRGKLSTWGECPGFDEALAAVKGLSTRYSDRVWIRIARMHTGMLPERITPEMLLKAAEMIALTYSDQLSSGSDAPPPSRSPGRSRSVLKVRRR